MRPVIEDLAAFLNARLDEDERYLKSNQHHLWTQRPLREVAFKRAILEWHYRGLPPVDAPEGLEICGGEGGDGDTWQMATPWPCPQIRALAAIWSDHPGYRQEWAP